MAQPFLYLASHCYGGLAHVRFMRSVLALRAACARRDIRLQLDLGGGEALLSRARAMMLARFLASEATHLLFADGDTEFEAEAVVEAVVDGRRVWRTSGGVVGVNRLSAEMVVLHSPCGARMSDIHGGREIRSFNYFESVFDPRTHQYRANAIAQIFSGQDEFPQ